MKTEDSNIKTQIIFVWISNNANKPALLKHNASADLDKK